VADSTLDALFKQGEGIVEGIEKNTVSLNATGGVGPALHLALSERMKGVDKLLSTLGTIDADYAARARVIVDRAHAAIASLKLKTEGEA
jgi:hypothetical protein